MKKSRSGAKLIALAFAHIAENELAFLEGFRDASPKGGKWELWILTGGYEANLRRLADRGQLAAAIGDFVSEEWVRALLNQKVKIIQLADSCYLQPIPNIHPDYSGMGEEAARMLQRNGCTALAFVGVPGHFSSTCYAQGFTRIAKDLSLEVTHCLANSPTRISDFVRDLRMPTGIFAASDRLARIVIESARTLRREVPQDIAVVGVGNRQLESLLAGIALSSFELPSYDLGRRAAQLLCRLLKKQDHLPLRSFPVRSHERESSLRISGRGLEKAVSYIKAHLETASNMEVLAQLAGMSRRSFEMAMRRNYKTSPARFVQDLRMRKAKDLLMQNELTISEISRACGYCETSVFCAAFRRWTGISPGEFRRAGLD